MSASLLIPITRAIPAMPPRTCRVVGVQTSCNAQRALLPELRLSSIFNADLLGSARTNTASLFQDVAVSEKVGQAAETWQRRLC